MNRNSTIIKSLLTLTGCLICNSIFATANLSILPSLSRATLPPGGAGSIVLKITNTSGATLSHIDIYNLNAPFSKSTTVPSTCTGTLANGASCSIEVNITDIKKATTFSPTVCAATKAGKDGKFCNLPAIANRTKISVVSAADAKAYIPSYHGNDVFVIDLKTDKVESTTIPVGKKPIGVSVSPNGKKVYVSNSNSVTAINTLDSQNATTTTIPVGKEPAGLVVSPDGSKTYVCNSESSTISVINTTSNTVTDTINIPGDFAPVTIAISPDGRKLFATNTLNKNIAVIDTTTKTVTFHNAGLLAPDGIVVSKDSAKLYITNFNADKVTIFNNTTNTVITTITVGSSPYGLALSPDGSKLYVTNIGNIAAQSDYTVSVINTSSDRVEATISQTAGQFDSPQGISVSPDNKKVLVVNSAGNNVSIINIPNNTLSSQVTVGKSPTAFGNFIG